MTRCREFPAVVAKLREIGSIIKANSRNNLEGVVAEAVIASKDGGYSGLGYAGLDGLIPAVAADDGHSKPNSTAILAGPHEADRLP
eukprot:SAG31_NODE_2973_length_4832_cov_11.390882_4_plen_86_part_00